MIGFPVNIFVYGLRFKKYIPGYREDYTEDTEDQLNKIKERLKKEIREKLDNMGFVN